MNYLKKLRREIVQETQINSLENKVSAEDLEKGPNNATKISTRIREDMAKYRGSAEDCQTNSWKINEDNEGGGVVGIKQKHDVATPNQEGNGYVKLEEDQGGGEIDATGTTDKNDRKRENLVQLYQDLVNSKMLAALPH